PARGMRRGGRLCVETCAASPPPRGARTPGDPALQGPAGGSGINVKMHTRRTAASWARLVAIVVVAGYLAATAARVYSRNYYLFLPGYVRWMASADKAPAGGPTHIFLLFTDHFEPDYDAAKTREWGA